MFWIKHVVLKITALVTKQEKGSFCRLLFRYTQICFTVENFFPHGYLQGNSREQLASYSEGDATSPGHCGSQQCGLHHQVWQPICTVLSLAQFIIFIIVAVLSVCQSVRTSHSCPANNFVIWSQILKLLYRNDHPVETTCRAQHFGPYLEGQGHSATLQQNRVRPITVI